MKHLTSQTGAADSAKNQAACSPLPWVAQINHCNHAVIDAQGFDVCTLRGSDYEAEGNAHLIARAVNTHAGMLKVLKSIVYSSEAPSGASTYEAKLCRALLEIAKEEISKAEGAK